MPTDSWSKRRILCGIKSRAKEERNALTEVVRTGQRKPTSNVGANERRTAIQLPDNGRRRKRGVSYSPYHLFRRFVVSLCSVGLIIPDAHKDHVLSIRING